MKFETIVIDGKIKYYTSMRSIFIACIIVFLVNFFMAVKIRLDIAHIGNFDGYTTNQTLVTYFAWYEKWGGLLAI